MITEDAPKREWFRVWEVVRAEPCPHCAVWIGPHRHLLRDDGSVGVIVEPIPAQPPVTQGEQT